VRRRKRTPARGRAVRNMMVINFRNQTTHGAESFTSAI